MTEPLVTIIIPCFNAEHFVGEAIDSALDQTYPRREVIVVDDGSTDRSPEVIKSFGDRIRWETGPNRGACAARNRGLQLARGEFIQFLDADDWLHADKLSRQLPLALENEDRLVFCDAATDGPPHPHHVRRDSTEDAVRFMLRGGLPTPAPLHRRAWLERVGGFREDLPCSQERDLHLRLAAAGLRFHRLAEKLFTVRRRADSLSANSERVLDQHAGILWPVYEDLQQRGELTDARRREFAGRLASDARAYLRLGCPDKAADYFQQARRMHPGGGLELAYSPASLWMRRLLGAAAVETVSAWRRARTNRAVPEPHA